MGYDFRTVRKVERVPTGHKAQDANPSLHRFNNQAMGLWRVAMLEWCEATYSATAPELPLFPPAGIDGVERAREVLAALKRDSSPTPPFTTAELDAGMQYLAAYEEVVTRPAIQEDQVGSFKFETNAGWLVTPEECRLLAEKIEPRGSELAMHFFSDAGFDRSDALDMVEAWVAYQRLAADHGGYRVW